MSNTSPPKPWLRTLPVHVLRTLLGALFVFAGAAHFFASSAGGESNPLITAFNESGYLMHMVKVTELVGGLLLLANRFVPLGLILLAPITLNIAVFHFVLTPGHDIGISIFVVAANMFLAWCYGSAFAGVLAPKTPIRFAANQ